MLLLNAFLKSSYILQKSRAKLIQIPEPCIPFCRKI